MSETIINTLTEQLLGAPFKFCRANKAADLCVGKDGDEKIKRFCIRLNAGESTVLFDGYVELHNFNGLLLIDQTTKVLTLVLDESESIDDEANIWLIGQLKKINLLHYTLRQSSLKATAKYTIEALFIINKDKAQKLEGKLNKLARETKLIHQISVNYITTNEITSINIQRVMPWLLLANNDWWTSRGEASTAGRTLHQLTHEDYRLPGKRTIKFAKHTNIHLFHGHNGSGKSTMAETIELWHTNKIRRLDERPASQYWEVLVNMECKANKESAATITFELDDQQTETVVIDSKYNRDEAACNSASFMLNQDFIDDLSRSREKERLNLFEAAFFSRERAGIDEYQTQRVIVNRWSSVLAKRLKCSNDYDAIFDKLDELRNRQSSQYQKELSLPVSLKQLSALVAFDPTSKAVLSRLSSATGFNSHGETLALLNAPIKQLLDSDISQDLVAARDVLNELADWHLAELDTQESYSQLLKRWAIEQAQIALLSNRLQLGKVCAAAFDADASEQLKAQTGTIELHGYFTLDTVAQARLNKQLQNLEQQHVQLTQQLEQSFAGSDDNQKQSEIGATKFINRQQAIVLDSIGGWLQDKEGQILTGLGNAVADIVNSRRSSEVAIRLGIHKSGWVKPLLEQLTQLIEAISRWKEEARSWKQANLGRGEYSTNAWWQLYHDAHAQFKTFNQMHQKVEQRFLNRLKDNGPLIHALNELFCLFTPARWLYRPLKLVYDQQEKLLKLRTTDKNGQESDASLLWNTARLNLVSVALFLLCANFEEHDRKTNTLVMDDPLQNMDELTVTYFARGLAKLAHYWREKGNNQQLIMLFHGEQAISQFSEELPAAVYHLPWRDANDQPITHLAEYRGFECKECFPFEDMVSIEPPLQQQSHS